MTTDSFDLDYEQQQIDMADTVAWDEIYSRARLQARDTGCAQLVLERGPSDHRLIDGRSPDALKLHRLRGAKVHVILDWGALG